MFSNTLFLRTTWYCDFADMKMKKQQEDIFFSAYLHQWTHLPAGMHGQITEVQRQSPEDSILTLLEQAVPEGPSCHLSGIKPQVREQRC